LLATFKQAGGVSSPDAAAYGASRTHRRRAQRDGCRAGEVVSANQPVFTVLNPESV
jgi:hypothetical protein